MQDILNFFKTDDYVLFSNILILILLVLFIILLISNLRLKSKYRKFIKKLGNGNDIEADLTNYMNGVEKVEKQNEQILQYCQNLDDDMTKCVQKIGIYRYNAYQNTGSNLSFAVSLLDENNSGVVFNGIYSSEMSNIYAKPVKNGKSEYALSEEEEESIKRAINGK